MSFLLPSEVFDQHVILLGKTVPRTKVMERLEMNIYKTPGCWLWTGYLKNGYGFTELQGVGVYAHELSFLIFRGPVPEGKEICHSCDIRQCVSPEHLFAGTRAENVQDAWRKGLGSQPPITRGSNHHLATLSDAQVIEIRRLMQAGATQRELARRFGCSSSTAWRIGKGITRA